MTLEGRHYILVFNRPDDVRKSNSDFFLLHIVFDITVVVVGRNGSGMGSGGNRQNPNELSNSRFKTSSRSKLFL